MSRRTLKVALIGCGQIADAHLQEVRKISGAEAVAVCDRHMDLARQAAARFEVPRAFDDADKMLADVKPDVVHVTTPPQTHLALGLKVLAAGSHLYMEKPFTLDAAEADQLLDAAKSAGRLVTVGHDNLFDPVWEECRQRVASGRLGRVVHVDSIQGYDLAGPFGKAFMSEPDHWVHRLPGGLFQNVMSHALYRIADFLPDESPRVWATWFGTTAAGDTPTELRVMLLGAEVTANLMFSSTMRPVQRVARVYGTKESIEVDLDGRTIRTFGALKLPGAFAKIEAPFRHRREAARSLRRAVWKFLRGDIHYFAGMNRLFSLFYDAVRDGTEPPIPYSEIRRNCALMDEIFRSAEDDRRHSADPRPRPRTAAATEAVATV